MSHHEAGQKEIQESAVLSFGESLDRGHRRLVRGSLSWILARGKKRAGVTFAGQGVVTLAPLEEAYHTRPSVRALVQEADRVLQGFVQEDEVRFGGLYPYGFALVDWLEDVARRPPQEVLSSSVLSQVLIFVSQIARWQEVWEDGLCEAWDAGALPVFTGHSQGLMPALLIAESAGGEVDVSRFGAFVEYMAWQGLMMAQAYFRAGHRVRQQDATPMAAVSGLSRERLEAFLGRFNRALGQEAQVVISLYNTRTRHVLSGPVESLRLLHDALQAQGDKEQGQKKQGRFAGKPSTFRWEYLPVGGAYHSPYMAEGLERMREKIAAVGFRVDAASLAVDVLSPATGKLYNEEEDLTETIMVEQFVRPVCWAQTLAQMCSMEGVMHLLDLGPGDGVARLSTAALRGTGVQVFAMESAQGREQVFARPLEELPAPLCYADFAPRLVARQDGQTRIENAYTRATGTPPVLLPGMTPTTVEAPLPAAAANAGYLAELAGGGQVTEEIFWRRMEELQGLLKPGQQVIFNALYLDPYLWDLHIRKGKLVQKARRAGMPLCGVTISAGIPPLEEAVALLDEFAAEGLWLNAFKPGTVAQVQQVVKIAQAARHHRIFVHLEGGKAGGHHSWEDLDALLLDTYHSLRSEPNIVLCVGGGIGSEQRATDLLTGRWSRKYDMVAMPVDAVFLGTLAMACQEAATSPSVKQALVAARGDEGWIFAGEQRGDLTSGKSQLNADIHYLDNAAARCGRLLDEVAGDEEAVAQQRDALIEALDQTAKPYFGELAQMTYAAVARRMVELMAIAQHGPYEDGPWLDRTHRTRMMDFLQRAEARLCPQQEGTFVSIFQDLSQLDDPQGAIDQLLAEHPQAESTLLHPVDVDFFIYKICARPGKPVNFVPVIDADVRRWYKADSLWQAHDARYEAEQVLVLPGPEAVQGLREVDEPVASLFGRFCDDLTRTLLDEGIAPAPIEERFSHSSLDAIPAGCLSEIEPGILTLRAQEDATTERWLGFLHEEFRGPIARLLGMRQLVTEARLTANPVRALCLARPGASIRVEVRKPRFIERLTYIPSPDADESLTLSLRDPQHPIVTLQLNLPAAIPSMPATPYTLELTCPAQDAPSVPTLSAQAQRDALRRFYHHTLFGRELKRVAPFAQARCTTSLSALHAQAYADLTGGLRHQKYVPLNMAFSLVWEPLFQALSCDELIEGVLQLVHLDNHITCEAAWPVLPDEEVVTTARITRIEDGEQGRTVHTLSTIARPTHEGEALCASVRSSFFIRGFFGHTPVQRRVTEPFVANISLQSQGTLALLRKQDWLTLPATCALQAQDTLLLEAELCEEHPRQGQASFGAQGTLKRGAELLCTFSFSRQQEDASHPVRALVESLTPQTPETPASRKPLAYTHTKAPQTLASFAEVSRDLNPIHRNLLIARLGGLQAPIVHGMWSAARLSQFMQQHLDARHVLDFHVSFLAPCPLGADLALEAVRTGVREGVMTIELTASLLQGDTQTPIVRAIARLKTPKVAYVFPGQGIQQKGMGMEGFARSKAARQVWERADAFTRNKLGFSILSIVRDNPRALVVQGKTTRHPQGVLHLTQFTQVAMAVLAQAQVAELREAGLLDQEAVLCGHSLGEYNAIAVTGVLPLETVIAVVYHRGMVMHQLVARDEHGESGYRMAVIRPHYAGLNHAQAEQLVQEIHQSSGHFLQIVNYNVRGRQYSVTGKIEALTLLQQELARKAIGSKPPYIEVPGIDVPFHSSILVDGVDNFRDTLEAHFPAQIDVDRLLGRYIPNLVPKPFSLSRAYIQEVAQTTQSPILLELLADFDAQQQDASHLARKLLIELLAWQFASPVRWIETQELLFGRQQQGGLGVKRIVEIGIGAQPTLANMARYSHKLLGPAAAHVEILNFEAEAAQVFYRDEEPTSLHTQQSEESAKTAAQRATDATDQSVSQADNTATLAPKAAIEAPPQPETPATIVQPQGAAAATEEIHSTCADALRALLALQAKVTPAQIRADESIDELFDGVSSRRNQVLLDLGAEFGIGPIDGAHELPLHKLQAELHKRAASYKAPGKYLKAAQDDALKRLFGRANLGRKELQGMLTELYGPGDGFHNAVFETLTLESREGASSRGGALGQLAEQAPTDRNSAKACLQAAVSSLAQARGIAIAPKSAQQDGSSAQVDATVVKELESRIIGTNGVLMNTARSIANALGHPLDAQGPTLPTQDPNAARLALYEAEHGPEYERLIAPRFDHQKHVALTSSWAWAQRDLAALTFDVQNQRIDEATARSRASHLARYHRIERIAQSARWYAGQAEGHPWLADLLRAIAEGTLSCGAAPCITRPHLTWDEAGQMQYQEKPVTPAPDVQAWLASLMPQSEDFRLCGDEALDAAIAQTLRDAWERGFDFRGETAVVTGASPGSIALACVQILLQGGARVILTTSTYNRARIDFYNDFYAQHASPQAELHVVPFNQASYQDTAAFVSWLFSTVTEQEGATVKIRKEPFAPTLVLPFAAIKDLATLNNITERSDAVMRAMLTGVERLLTGIADEYQQRGIPSSPCHVVLPLSPNHGNFGGDGVYAETKAALEVLLEKWTSEADAWANALTFCGARIGWVRGTGLMDANNPLAAMLEEHTDLRTFSSSEMGLLLTALCGTDARKSAQQKPLRADLTGGFTQIPHFKQTIDQMRAKLTAPTAAQDAPQTDTHKVLHALPNWPAPTATPFVDTADKAAEQGHAWPTSQASLEQTVVIVGLGELGPYGTSRARFAMEVEGELCPASILELAWITGLVRYDTSKHNGTWIDTESEEAIPEEAIAARYREILKTRVGLRFTEPTQTGFDPEGLPVFSTVFLEKDFTFPVSSAEEAETFVQADPAHTEAHYDNDSETWRVTRLAGSAVRVPRKVRLDRRVTGQLPDGFSLARFGIPQEMIEHVDRLTLFNLVATVDAFLSAGLSPEELLRWIHPARIANTQGAGIGGMQSLHRLYLDHILDHERQNDTLQETLINVIAAYVVQSYVGSYGAMSHPVAACATAAVSLEEGMDKILLDKADFVVTGGYDDLGKEGAIGFRDMNATANSQQMAAMGLEPQEHSRANDIRRRGFVEAQGGGTVLLTRADIALKLGLPVYGVLAYAGSFADGIHKSIPAPGMGALAAAAGGTSSPLARALQRHGLSADDIALVYKHDTSTNANDPNESELHQRIQQALARTPGNPLWVVSQKTLTGHPKGGAAAWQIIGLCQSLQAGTIPGNRNLQCVDPVLRNHDLLGFTNKTLKPHNAQPLRAGLVTSLGFGHVSGIALILHPDAFAAIIPDDARDAYQQQRQERQQQHTQQWARACMEQAPLFQKRTDRRFAQPDDSSAQKEQEAKMLLNPLARLDEQGKFVDASTRNHTNTPPDTHPKTAQSTRIHTP